MFLSGSILCKVFFLVHPFRYGIRSLVLIGDSDNEVNTATYGEAR
jgi:hypothetical protein